MSKSEFQANLELVPLPNRNREPIHPAVLALRAKQARKRRNQRILAAVVWTSVIIVAGAVSALIIFTR